MKTQIETVYPLSPAQEGMLFHCLEAPDSGVYVHQIRCSLEGFLDVAALERAWRWVQARHGTLRTAFAWKRQDRPVQVVLRDAPLTLERRDGSALPPERREELVATSMDEERRRGFDLAKAPLLRVVVVRRERRRWELLITTHHLVVDGWSMPLVTREVFVAYQAFRDGAEPELPQPPPFSRFISWIEAQDRAETEAFWKRSLDGFGGAPPLPGERPAATGREEPRRRIAVPWPAADTAPLQALARSQRVSLGAVLSAAWGLVLARGPGRDEAAFGLVVAGRPPELPEVESMVGMFINTLPLRLEIEDDLPVADWVQHAHQRQAELQRHSQSALVDIHTWSGAPREQPLFQSIFAFENYPQAEVLERPLAELAVTGVEVVEETQYPLSLSVQPGDTVQVAAGFDPGRLEETAVRRLLERFRTVLLAMAEAPHDAVGDLPRLLPAERQQLLVEWNEPRPDYAADVPAHELVAAWAARRPDAIASVAGEARLTHGGLEARSNRLARHLRRLGVGPEVAVGVCLAPGLDLVVAILAVFKAGGVYLPLDPELPPARLALVLEDAQRGQGTRLLVTAAPWRSRCSGDATVVDLDRDRREIVAVATDPPPDRTDLDAAAYTIYTSGSTGVPKGVQVSHRALANRLEWARRAEVAEEGEGDIANTLRSSIGFDGALAELFMPLVGGGRVVVVAPERSRDFVHHLELVRRERVTQIGFPPAVLLRLLEEGALAGCSSLASVRVAGEAVPPHLVERYYDSFDVPLINRYGPTETTISVLSWRLPPGERGSVVPIGRPIARAEALVLDRGLRPLPPGTPGELHLGGPGLARGYPGRAGLTAENFVPHPAGAPGTRLYCTGDRVRHRHDGALEFLGRVDGQVQVRGFRVEPVEVEAVLSGHPEVREAAVVASADGSRETRLVAYVVPLEGRHLDVRELTAFLRHRLPAPMVPSAIGFLDALPLTENGKVDRRALASQEPAELLAGRGRTPPVGALEQLVAEVWEEVLGVEGIAREDDFFAVGGHSLRVTQVVSRLRRNVGVELTVRAVFDHPTLAELTHRVEAELVAGRRAASAPLEPEERGAEAPLSFAQERLFFLDRLQPGRPTYNIFRGLELQGELSPAALEQALEQIEARHEVLRATYTMGPEAPLQVVAPATRRRLPVVDLDRLGPAEGERVMRALAQAEADRPFDLESDRVLRATLLRRGREHHALLLTLHHIAGDGWSARILERELGDLYRRGSEGVAARLPRLPVQYPDYAIWQRRSLSPEVVRDEIAWWQRRLSGLPPVLDLPADRPRPPRRSGRGGTVHRELGAELTAALRRLSRRRGATLFMTLLAGYAALLGRLAGISELAVGTPVAGRNRLELEPLVGFFINTLVLRCDLSGDPTLEELVTRLRSTVLEAHAHGELPFEKLVDELAPERNLAYSPIFQVTFAVEEARDPATDLEGLRPREMPVAPRTAKFDLGLAVAVTGEGLTASLEHDRDLFDAATAGRWLGHLEALLRAAVVEPERPASELPLLGAGQRWQLLGEWNDTATQRGPAPSLASLIDAQARRRLEAVAVVSGERHLTFGALARRAEALGRRLERMGVGPEVPVGLLAEPSAELLVGLMGILWAGGAYVPLEPEHPRRRLRSMLADCAAPVLVTQERLLQRLGPGGPDRVLLEEVPGPSAIPGEGGWSEPRARGDGLAYVIYTSGSTGRPKGVACGHAGVLRLLGDFDRREPLAPGQRASFWTSLGFDVSVYEIFSSLVAGGALEVVPPDLRPDGESFVAWLEARRIESAYVPPFFLPRLEDDVASGRVRPALSRLLVGVEPIPEPRLARITRGVPGLGTINGYGPTEATVCATLHDVRPPRARDGRTPIGRPVLDLAVHLVDPAMRPVPLGAAGELCIGGVGVARGYHRRPGQTAERFVPNPFGSPGGRLYRTGDLARRLGDGEIEFLGRRDHQVKLRGLRIELGEIEGVLRRHPNVGECVAVVSDDERLLAYVTDAGRSRPDPEEIRRYLRERLPGPFVPALVVPLDVLPRTPSAKVDRRALAEMAPRPTPAGDSEAAPPRDAYELRLVRIWESLLKRDLVGVTDDFFALGGNSLLGLQLVAQIEEAFGFAPPVELLIERPTIEDLAAVLRERSEPEAWSPLVTIRSGGSRPPQVWVHPVGGGVACYAELARHVGPDQPFLALQARGVGGGGSPLESVETMAAEYLGALEESGHRGPLVLGGWSLGGLIAYEMALRLHESGRPPAGLVFLDTWVPGRHPRWKQITEIDLLGEFAKQLGLPMGDAGAGEVPRDMPAEAALGFIWQAASAARVLPPGLGLSEVRNLFRTFRIHVDAFLRYQLRPYPGKIHFFRSFEGLAAGAPDPALLWEPVVEEIELYEAEGGHFGMLRGEHARRLGRRLEELLAEPLAAGSQGGTG